MHMEGSYDLDGDGLKEFATVESGSIGGKQKSIIRYYEINQDGFQEVAGTSETSAVTVRYMELLVEQKVTSELLVEQPSSVVRGALENELPQLPPDLRAAC